MAHFKRSTEKALYRKKKFSVDYVKINELHVVQT